jgi:hypothetical protein
MHSIRKGETVLIDLKKRDGWLDIVDFRLRLMTLQQFSSGHAPCKPLFDQRTPFLLVVAASE